MRKEPCISPTSEGGFSRHVDFLDLIGASLANGAGGFRCDAEIVYYLNPAPIGGPPMTAMSRVGGGPAQTGMLARQVAQRAMAAGRFPAILITDFQYSAREGMTS